MIEGVYLLLGTNLGDKISNLNKAKRAINKSVGEIIKCSKLYETEAWGKQNQPSFLNQVVEIRSDKDPEDILERLLAIEKDMGRVRKEKWGERLIDIDILYYSDVVYNSDKLKIPHPGIAKRRFTLVPLVELKHDFVHPVFKKTNYKLLYECKDQLKVTEASSVN